MLSTVRVKRKVDAKHTVSAAPTASETLVEVPPKGFVLDGMDLLVLYIYMT